MSASRNAAWLPEISVAYDYDNGYGYDYAYDVNAEDVARDVLAGAAHDTHLCVR